MSKMTKRALPILVLTIFLFTIIPILPAHAAIGVTAVEDTAGNAITDGQKGDTVVVKGGGVTAGVTVNLYWDAVKAWDGEKGLLNSTEAAADGTFEIWFEVPEAAVGLHYIWLKDTETGDTWGGGTEAASDFTVNPKITLSPTTGLKEDVITISGYGFSAKKEIVTVQIWDGVNPPEDLTTTPSTPETDDLGSWSATFEVPDKTYDDYTIITEDEDGNGDTATLTIGPTITIDPESGPVGSVVTVTGRGFTGDEKIDKAQVEISNGVFTENCYVIDGPVTIKDNGEFTISIVIPQTPDVDDDYTITVTETDVGGDGAVEAEADFEVTGLAEIKADPSYGPQGTVITIHGYNFTAISGKDVVVTLDGEGDKTFETDENGEFSGSFSVPAVATGTKILKAEQADYEIDAEKDFRVGLMLVILTPSEGATGTEVTITGVGFTDDPVTGKWNATFGDIAVTGAEEDVEDDGTISKSFYVPTVDVGTYTVTVLDIDTDIEVTAEFEVTHTTTVSVDLTSAPNNYNITIKGWFFADIDNGDLDFVLYNATNEWDMAVKQGKDPGKDAVTNEDGNFTAWWKVPDSDTLDIGDYTINVTDGEDLFAQVTFSVVEEEISISPRKAEFAISDTVSFDIESSFKQEDSYIKIWDPDGNLYWKTDLFEAGDWIKVGTLQTVPYYSQVSGGNPMILISDAPLGTWSWTWYDADGDELDSGTFTVVAAPESVLAEQVADLETAVSSLSDDVSSLAEDVAGVKTDVAAAKAAADAAKAAASSAEDAVSDIAETANSAKSAAENAASAASEAKSAAEEAKSAASGLTTLVYGAIGASLVAALAAIVSLMQISRRIAG